MGVTGIPWAAWLVALVSTMPVSPELQALLESHPADSLARPLRLFEAEHGRVQAGGEAALLLGRLHYARGEYRQAASAFARAAARLEPTQKHEARYWEGLCWLGLRDPNRARAVLEEVIPAASTRRADAMLALALAWELAERPDRAFDTLERLLEEDPGEAGPAAIERLIVLAEALNKPEGAEQARERLLGDYPNSIEAARVAAPPSEPAADQASGSVAVQIGTYSRSSRARSLLDAALRAGFTGAQVVSRGEGRTKEHAVWVGVYPSAEEAARAGEEAARKLGVSYRLVATR